MITSILPAYVRILATYEPIVSWCISFVGFAVYHNAAFAVTSFLLLGKHDSTNIAQQRAASHAPFRIQRERNLITLAGYPVSDKFFHLTCQLCKIFETSRSLIIVHSSTSCFKLSQLRRIFHVIKFYHLKKYFRKTHS